jgi:hypothetical protein
MIVQLVIFVIGVAALTSASVATYICGRRLPNILRPAQNDYTAVTDVEPGRHDTDDVVVCLPLRPLSDDVLPHGWRPNGNRRGDTKVKQSAVLDQEFRS